MATLSKPGDKMFSKKRGIGHYVLFPSKKWTFCTYVTFGPLHKAPAIGLAYGELGVRSEELLLFRLSTEPAEIKLAISN